MATTTGKNDYGYPDGPTSEPDFLHVHKGVKSWLTTLDHKRIGMMYLFGILTSLLVGGAFALLVRTELWSPGKTIVGQDTYNQFFTLHGAVMVFLVIIPGIPAALGNIIMPIQLGAPDVAFPRLNLASFYLWISGALLLVGANPVGRQQVGQQGTLGGGKRFEVQAEAKNIFNFEEVTAVSNTITVDLDGYPVDPVTLVRLPLSSISTDTSDYAANGWREQRKFQLGFKFFF